MKFKQITENNLLYNFLKIKTLTFNSFKYDRKSNFVKISGLKIINARA